MSNLKNNDPFEEMGIETQGINEALESVLKESDDLVNTGEKENGFQLHTDERDSKQHRIMYGLNEKDREQAVLECVIPKCYKDAAFDSSKVKANLREQNKKSQGLYKVYNFNKYEETCNGILTAIRMNKLPTRSYLIGAPNGFGKTSFVNECLITLRKSGKRVVPYISLSELAELRSENEARLMKPFAKARQQQYNDREPDSRYMNGLIENGPTHYYEEYKVFKGYVKTPEVVTGRYSYSEYINADCLFVYLTDVVSKELESHMLYQLLSIRGAKGLPTIVLMSTSLEPYINDRVLKELVWDEIRAYNEKEYCYDRIYHVSCYKRKANILDSKGENAESDTGIID